MHAGWPRVPELFPLGVIARLDNMIAQSKTKVRLWQLLLAILAISFGLVFFTSETFSVTTVVVIEALLLLTLAALFLPDLFRWWGKR